MATALDIIKRSMRILGVLASGATPTTDEQTDMLAVLNTLLDGMNNDGLLIYHMQEENFALSSGTGSYTIGTGATFSTTRPLRILGAFVRDANDFDYPLEVIDEDRWRQIGLKSLEGDFPEFLYYEASMANGKIWLNPEPGAGLTLYLSTEKQLASLATTGTTVTLPPGYQELIEYELAERAAPEFGVTLSENAERARRRALARVKRTNVRVPTMGTQLCGIGDAAGNILQGA